jgi:hypothetical protein
MYDHVPPVRAYPQSEARETLDFAAGGVDHHTSLPSIRRAKQFYKS